MKKRRIKKGKLFLFIVGILFIIAGVICGILYLNRDKNNDNPSDEVNIVEEKPEEPKEKRMSLVAVGDALIHGAVYMDAAIGNNNYDFSSLFTDVAPLIQDYDLKYYNQETI